MIHIRILSVLFMLLALTTLAGKQKKKLPQLPPPDKAVPDNPAVRPSVVSAGGQRLLLGYVKDKVKVEYKEGKLVASPKNWWIINYPLDKKIMKQVFGGKPIKNWYILSPGASGPEPPRPTGPAPVELHEKADLIVDVDRPNASDANPGTADRPLKSINAALKKAKAGMVIQVRPGIYRETKLSFSNAGTRENPVILEGVRDAAGNMPVISANVPFPRNAFKPVSGLDGVYRADNITQCGGVVTVNGEALQEGSFPHELQEGEVCFNRASTALLKPRTGPVPAAGMQESGLTWRRVAADDKGLLRFNPDKRTGAFYLSVWVYSPRNKYDRKNKSRKIIWEDGGAPVPVNGDIICKGAFRAFRMTGIPLNRQPNKYRLWVNGTAMPSAYKPDMACPQRNYGHSDKWYGSLLHTGWNHLLFKFDITRPMKDMDYFYFSAPKELPFIICSGDKPESTQMPPADRSNRTKWLSEALVLGPLPTDKADMGVYVRLKNGADPNRQIVDIPRGGEKLLDLDKPYLQARGFVFRGGMLFQQRAMVNVSGKGSLLEGCMFKSPEVRAVTVALSGMNQLDDPIVIRNNYVYNPGGLGFGAAGSSEKLTAENQSNIAPGRGRMIAEYNFVTGNNSKGYKMFWESGSMKFFRLTGCVIRYNHSTNGNGPAAWFDWEHYANRATGNLSVNDRAFAQGFEASPGPNLACNNLTVNLRNGDVWFRWAVLAWSSGHSWALFNTIDDMWNQTKAWKGQTGANGIYLAEGPEDRHTRWGAIKKKNQIANNICVNMCVAAARPHVVDALKNAVYTNSKKVKGGIVVDVPDPFRNTSGLDYRLNMEVAKKYPAVMNNFTKYVRHDFYGLLRFADQPQYAGAFRVDPVPADPESTRIEVEYADGQMERLYKVK